MSKTQLLALSAIVTVSPALAAQSDSSQLRAAPIAPADARYCLRVDPLPDSRVATIRCETRLGWAELGVDLDQEWPTQGVRIIGPK